MKSMTEDGKERYMEKIWMRALDKKVQKKALSSEKKRHKHGKCRTNLQVICTINKGASVLEE